jgi:hypothetical protein
MGERQQLEPTGTELVAILRGPHFRHNMGALFHNLLPQIAKMARAFLALATLLSLSACVTSKSPLLGPESRVLPFPSGTTFAVYERDTEQKPWTRQRDVTLVADQQLEVRDEEHPKDGVTFHRQGQRRYLVQGNFGTYYAYGVLEIRNGEGLLKWMACSKIDKDAFRAAGGTIGTEGLLDLACQLDSASKPLDLLRTVADHASGFELRYVPVVASAPAGKP